MPGRRASGLLKTVALIDISVLTETVHATCAGHELPQARGGGPRNSFRLPGTLHLAQPGDVQRHAFLGEDLPRESHVHAGATQTVFHRRAAAGSLVVIDVLLNERIERE